MRARIAQCWDGWSRNALNRNAQDRNVQSHHPPGDHARYRKAIDRLAQGVAASLTLIIAAVLPATAQVAIAEYDQFQSRYGMAQVRSADGEEQLYVNGSAAPGIAGASVAIQGAWAREEEEVDWLIVSSRTGDACPPPRFFVAISPEGFIVSQSFGHCVADLLDIRVLPGRIEVDVPHADPAIAHETIAFDGREISTELVAAPAPAAALATVAEAGASAGASVTGTALPAIAAEALRLVGEHASAPLGVAEWRMRFLSIMTDADFADLTDRLHLSEGIVQRGDWVLAEGCARQNCGLRHAVWGVRTTDGMLAAAILDSDAPIREFGPAGADAEFAGWIAETLELLE